MIPRQAAAELTAQHLVLVSQHQQLDVLGQVRADQHHQQAEQGPHQAVAASRDDASHATDPAAKPQLTPRDRVSERDTMAVAATFSERWQLGIASYFPGAQVIEFPYP
jgi:hypothetical protein